MNNMESPMSISCINFRSELRPGLIGVKIDADCGVCVRTISMRFVSQGVKNPAFVRYVDLDEMFYKYDLTFILWYYEQLLRSGIFMTLVSM